MDTDIEKLYRQFLKIKKMGYVKSLRDGPTGLGYTFESLLGKDEDRLSLPDFESIEIKTMTILSRRKIHLFNATPDGDLVYPIKRILDLLGYPDKQNPQYKVFQMDVNAKKDTWIGYYKKMILYVNDYEKKIELIAYRSNGRPIELQTSWSFHMLEERLVTKMPYLAIVEAEKKQINGSMYYYYKRISFFKLRDFKIFLKLLKKGKILITFKIGTIKEGENAGAIHDHGTDFSLFMEDVPLLYKKIY